MRPHRSTLTSHTPALRLRMSPTAPLAGQAMGLLHQDASHHLPAVDPRAIAEAMLDDARLGWLLDSADALH